MAQAANYVLIGISNSFTKLAFASGTRIFRPSRIATSKLTRAYLRRFAKRRKFDMVVVCSVVPKKNRLVSLTFGKTTVFWLNWRLTLGVGIDYPHPRSIGA